MLYPDAIKESEPVGVLSSAAPQSTTAALAGNVPKQSKSEESVPGAFPMTPPAATPGSEPQTFSVNPIPATEGLGNPVKLAPGEKVPEPSTLTSNTVQSTVKDDKPDQEEKVSVAPIPATAGAGNPIHLEPGEKVPDPSTLTSNTILSTAKTDPASYEKSDALPPQLGPVVTPEADRNAKGGMFDLPSLAKNVIPESSLPMGQNGKLSNELEKDPGVTIQSAAPTSTTTALAAQVPKEPSGVPSTVTESQKEAHFPPEASANPEAVQEKQELEHELKEKVPEEPPAAESGLADTVAPITSKVAPVAQQAAGIASAGVGAATSAIGGTFLSYSGQDKKPEARDLSGQAPASEVPEVVAESQKEAHVSPEASANPEAVSEKKEVEAELLKGLDKTGSGQVPVSEVPAVVAESQKEAHVSPEASASKEAVLEKKEVEAELLKEVKQGGSTGKAPVSEVPAVVAESQKTAHVDPEATANKEAVEEKKDVEAELLKEVKKSTEAGEPAPTVTAATSETAPGLSEDALSDTKPLQSSSEPDVLNAPASKPALPETSVPAADSRDISPMSKQPTTTEQTQPVVTTGVGSSTTAAKTAPATPHKPTVSSAKGTPESISSNTTDKKSKRRSFFGKLKDKFKN